MRNSPTACGKLRSRTTCRELRSRFHASFTRGTAFALTTSVVRYRPLFHSGSGAHTGSCHSPVAERRLGVLKPNGLKQPELVARLVSNRATTLRVGLAGLTVPHNLRPRRIKFMKRGFITGLILVALAAGGYSSTRGTDNNGPREQALVEFTKQVKLLDVFLKGNYIVIHDEDRMAESGACLFVYRSENGKPGRLVVSYHCEPVTREPVDQFTVRLSNRSSMFDVPEIKEIQFAGSSRGHLVTLAR